MRVVQRVVKAAFPLGWILFFRCHPPESPPVVRIGCLPRLAGTAWIGVAGADGFHEWLEASSRRYRIIPLDWSFQALDRDSAQDTAYLLRYAARIHLDTVLIVQADSIDGDRYRLDWRLSDLTGRGKSLIDTIRLEDLREAVHNACFSFFPTLKGKGADFHIDQPVPALTKARLALLLGDWEAAERLLQPFEGSVHEGRLPLLEAQILYQKWIVGLRDPTRLDELLSRLDRTGGSSRPKELAMARLLILKESWGLAEARLERVLAEDPDDAEALFLLSRFHPSRYRKWGYASPQALLKKALAINPACEKAALALAQTAFYDHRFDEAERVYESMLAIHPRSWEAWMGLGKLAMVRRDFPRVVRIYETLLALRPFDPEIVYNLGVLYFHEGRRDEARAFFQRAIAEGEIPDAYYYLGVIAEQEGKKEEAIDWYRERIRRRRDAEDVFAEEARRALFRLLNEGRDASEKS